MKTQNLILLRANLVMVFDNLKSARISRDQLRDAIPGGDPEYVEMGELIVVKNPGLNAEIIVLVETRRIEIKVEKPIDESWQLIPKMSIAARQAVDRSQLVGYGFNFFAEIEFLPNVDASKFLLKQFEPALRSLQDELGGELINIEPRLDYVVDSIPYQLILQPYPNHSAKMNINLNVHYATKNMPEESVLSGHYIQRKDHFLQTIESLFDRK